MRIDIITVLPELLDGPLNNSILKRAQDKGLAEIVVHNLRDFTLDKHRRVDDYPFGGPGAVFHGVQRGVPDSRNRHLPAAGLAGGQAGDAGHESLVMPFTV